jgi:hypothetical protein
MRDKSLQYFFDSLVDVMIETLPEFLNEENTRVNLVPDAALNLIETNNCYCVITLASETEYTECIDSTIPAVRKEFTIYIGSHNNEDLINMRDEIMNLETDSGMYKIKDVAQDYFENLELKLGSNPFIIYDSGLCELVLNISVVN